MSARKNTPVGRAAATRFTSPVLLFGAASGAPPSDAMDSPAPRLRFLHSNYPVHLGCQRTGVRLVGDRVAPADYIELSRERFVLLRGGERRVIHALGDLRGAVSAAFRLPGYAGHGEASP